MASANKTDAPIGEFVDKSAIDALSIFVNSDDERKYSGAADVIIRMFGFGTESISELREDSDSLTASFKRNLSLLIQKTWVEKTDEAMKETVLYRLEKFRADSSQSWKESHTLFYEILCNAVYLMFGQEAHEDDFLEYALRIDPEFGIFWWYVEHIPNDAEWSEQKCRDAALLGMYFLANY